jgi:hypothetical protein
MNRFLSGPVRKDLFLCFFGSVEIIQQPLTLLGACKRAPAAGASP